MTRKPRHDNLYWCSSCESWKEHLDFGRRRDVACNIRPHCHTCSNTKSYARVARLALSRQEPADAP